MKKSFDRRQFLYNTAAAGLTGLLSGCLEICNTGNNNIISKKPNVIFILTDDQGYGDMSCHGNPVLRTPWMDSLHERSVRLTNFHVDPTCSPTRAAFMTGRYSIRTGVWHTINGRSMLGSDEITMADLFQQAGYKTACFGKWHLGDNYPFRPQDRGFDEVLIHGGGGIGQTPDYWGNDYEDDTYFRNGKPEKFKGYCTDVWFSETIKFIEKNKRQPFFCYLATNAPHGPYIVSDEYKQRYVNQPNIVNPEFYGMIDNLDENLGTLLRFLQQTGLEKNTILIFAGDNGTSAGAKTNSKGFVTKGFNTGMRGKKGSVYEGGHRTHCFVYWPSGGIKGPKDINELSAHIDIMPTLCELCNLHYDKNITFDGISLADQLSGDNKQKVDRSIIVTHQRIEIPDQNRPYVVMKGTWRLVNGTELYDIDADPEQKKDVSGHYSEILVEMQKDYDRWWNDVSGSFGDYCRIIINSDAEPVTKLNAMDLHTKTIDSAWTQRIIAGLTKEAKNEQWWNSWWEKTIPASFYAKGFWAVEFEKSGTYTFELRRWPRELDKSINAALPTGKPTSASRAQLKIRNRTLSKQIKPGAKSVIFEFDVSKGPAEIEAKFIEAENKAFSAFYVYVYS